MSSRGLAKVAAGLTAVVPLGVAGLAAGAHYLTRRRETLTAEEAAPDGGFLPVNAAQIHYVAAGAGEPAILVHGFGASTFSWRHNLTPLAGTRRIYALDLPGFGYSSRLTRPGYSLREAARTVRGFLDSLGMPRASLIGSSLGGAVVLQFAHDFPEAVDKLVLVSAAAYELGPFPFAQLPLSRELAMLLVHYAAGSERRIATILRGVYGDPDQATPEAIAGYFRPLRVKGSAAALWAMLASRRDADVPERLGAIAKPALLIWGDRDPIIPLAQGERLARDLPEARLVVLPGVGHAPAEERPDEFNRLVSEFLDEAGAH